MPHPLTVVAAAAACITVMACAAEPLPREVRVQVRLTRPAVDADAVAREASRIAGTPVRHVVANSNDWHVLTLQCADEPACDRAVQRLRDNAATYRAVDVDQRRRIHTP